MTSLRRYGTAGKDRANLSFEGRIRLLEDLEDIKRLRILYHVFFNSREFNRVPELFTSDGVLKLGGLFDYHGHQEIEEGLIEVGSKLQIVKQFLGHHVVDVDGDTAHGVADMEARYGYGGISLMVAGRYDETYVRTDNGWRISYSNWEMFFAVPPTVGWAGERLSFLEIDGREAKPPA